MNRLDITLNYVRVCIYLLVSDKTYKTSQICAALGILNSMLDHSLKPHSINRVHVSDISDVRGHQCALIHMDVAI